MRIQTLAKHLLDSAHHIDFQNPVDLAFDSINFHRGLVLDLLHEKREYFSEQWE